MGRRQKKVSRKKRRKDEKEKEFCPWNQGRETGGRKGAPSVRARRLNGRERELKKRGHAWLTIVSVVGKKDP